VASNAISGHLIAMDASGCGLNVIGMWLGCGRHTDAMCRTVLGAGLLALREKDELERVAGRVRQGPVAILRRRHSIPRSPVVWTISPKGE